MFKVGDIIECNDRSDNPYVYTTKGNHYVGRVVAIDSDGCLAAITLECYERHAINMRYGDLNPIYFRLKINYQDKLQNFINSLSDNVKH